MYEISGEQVNCKGARDWHETEGVNGTYAEIRAVNGIAAAPAIKNITAELFRHPTYCQSSDQPNGGKKGTAATAGAAVAQAQVQVQEGDTRVNIPMYNNK
jgi:hypothetical protein